MKLRVKICGLTRERDIELALALGATHLGFVLEPSSPRAIAIAGAAELAQLVGERAPCVLVYRRAECSAVLEAIERTGVTRVQVHVLDAPQAAALRRGGALVHRVFAVPPEARALPELAPAPTEAEPALFDVGLGGSGRGFDWSLLGERAPACAFVAGGVTPENLVALLVHRPWGIDVASGVESAPGVKSSDALRRLFDLVEKHA